MPSLVDALTKYYSVLKAWNWCKLVKKYICLSIVPCKNGMPGGHFHRFRSPGANLFFDHQCIIVQLLSPKLPPPTSTSPHHPSFTFWLLSKQNLSFWRTRVKFFCCCPFYCFFYYLLRNIFHLFASSQNFNKLLHKLDRFYVPITIFLFNKLSSLATDGTPRSLANWPPFLCFIARDVHKF